MAEEQKPVETPVVEVPAAETPAEAAAAEAPAAEPAAAEAPAAEAVAEAPAAEVPAAEPAAPVEEPPKPIEEGVLEAKGTSFPKYVAKKKKKSYFTSLCLMPLTNPFGSTNTLFLGASFTARSSSGSRLTP